MVLFLAVACGEFEPAKKDKLEVVTQNSGSNSQSNARSECSGRGVYYQSSVQTFSQPQAQNYDPNNDYNLIQEFNFYLPIVGGGSISDFAVRLLNNDPKLKLSSVRFSYSDWGYWFGSWSPRTFYYNTQASADGKVYVRGYGYCADTYNYGATAYTYLAVSMSYSGTTPVIPILQISPWNQTASSNTSAIFYDLNGQLGSLNFNNLSPVYPGKEVVSISKQAILGQYCQPFSVEYQIVGDTWRPFNSNISVAPNTRISFRANFTPFLGCDPEYGSILYNGQNWTDGPYDYNFTVTTPPITFYSVSDPVYGGNSPRTIKFQNVRVPN